MNRWAHYVITAVGYDVDRNHISRLLVRPDEGEWLGSGEIWTKEQVVASLKLGYSFVTSYLNGGKWIRGASVHVVEIGSKQYLRTDQNRTAADNLGSLPELPSGTGDSLLGR